MSLREWPERELSWRLTPADREGLSKEWDVSLGMDRERAERTLNLYLRSAHHDPSHVEAIIYARSATAEQQGDGMRPQVERCRAYCWERGYKVVSEASDVRSGLTPPDLGWPPPDAHVLVVDRPDRLSRDPELLEAVEQGARLRGLRVEYASEGAGRDA